MKGVAEAESLKSEPTLATYYEVRIPGAAICFRLNLNVVDRLAADVTEGFKAVPRRGLEIGGLLLGRRTADCVVVEQFEAIASEHQRGPSWLLSEKDLAGMAEAVGRLEQRPDGIRLVGLYRSHTRTAVEPTAEDAALLEKFEAAGASVFLLLKPAAGQPSAARLFAAESGLRGEPAQFKLHRGLLSGEKDALVEMEAAPQAVAAAVPKAQDPVVESQQTPHAQPAQHAPRLNTTMVMAALAQQLERAQANQPTPPVFPAAIENRAIPAPPQRRNRNLRLVWAAAILVSAGIGGYAMAKWWHGKPRVVETRANSMALTVAWVGGSLHLSWDRDAPLIRQAQRAVVWIGDGAQQRRLDLDARELTEGTIQYRPSSSDVGIKLEVFGPDLQASESVRAINVPHAGKSEAPPRLTSERKPPERRPLPQPELIRPESVILPARLVRPDSHPFARVEMEAVKQTPLSAAASKILPKRFNMTDPPKALHREIPTVTPALNRAISGEVQVDVKLDLDPTGKIQKAEVLSRHQGAARQLDDLALNTSRRWKFEAARSGERRILSRVILHYRFGMPTLAQGPAR